MEYTREENEILNNETYSFCGSGIWKAIQEEKGVEEEDWNGEKNQLQIFFGWLFVMDYNKMRPWNLIFPTQRRVPDHILNDLLHIFQKNGSFGFGGAFLLELDFFPRIGPNIFFITFRKPDSRPVGFETRHRWAATSERLRPRMAWFSCTSKERRSYWSTNVLYSSPNLLKVASMFRIQILGIYWESEISKREWFISWGKMGLENYAYCHQFH